MNFTLPSGPVQLRFPSGIAASEFKVMKQLLDVYFSGYELQASKADGSSEN
ncbi:MAG: hypothetical protein JSR64_21810 [Nitrospira sp.]|nr:hypothetical protein [Nitrospira sp.]